MEVFLVIAVLLGGLWAVLRFARSRPKSASTGPVVSPVPGDKLEAAFDEMLTVLAEGKAGMSTNVMLDAGEVLVLDIPGITLLEERSTGVKGGSRGVSVRVMKGMSVRLGSFKGTITKDVVPIDKGSLTITSKRMVYAGGSQTRSFPLQSILAIDALEDGFAVSRKGKQKVEYYRGTTIATLSATIKLDDGTQQQVDWKLTGAEVQLLVQRLRGGPK